MRDDSRIPYEGHLLLVVKRMRLVIHQQAVMVEIARETEQPLPSKGATAAGDPLRLRGVPFVGRGVSGAMHGTRPGGNLDQLDRDLRLIAVLAQDIDGTSPGSQPEEALLAAEADRPATPVDLEVCEPSASASPGRVDSSRERDG